MVFGGADREVLQLNEDSIWSGPYRDRNNPAAKQNLPVIRKLLSEGRVREAEELCLEAFSAMPAAQRVYQTAGELHIDFSPEGMYGHGRSGTRAGPLLPGIRSYRRDLDISTAVLSVSFAWEGVSFRREYFCSAPAGVLAVRFTASRPGMISFRAHLSRGIFSDRMENIACDTIAIASDQGIPFCMMAKAVLSGGRLHTRGGFLTVEKADEALLLLDIRTAFRETDYAAACHANLNRCADLPYQQLLSDHTEDYRGFFNRLEFDLYSGGAENSGNHIPTDQLLRQIDNNLIVLYYQYCRYLLISSSRPGTLPANLQGIWNPHMDPPWGSDYTININTQMNYWPACMCNLAETEGPLFDLLERAYPHGRKTAEVMYGCRGFVAHHNMDIWGDTAPRDYWLPGTYGLLGAAWLAIHIREHYEYTLDRSFLEQYYYLIREACLFFVDFLIPGNRTNEAGDAYLMVSPSVSPENSYRFPPGSGRAGETGSLCAGCEMDNQILRKLFWAAIRSAEELGCGDDETTARFRSIRRRIPGPRIHPNGTICEWNEVYEECDPGHRHMSHLWALWPGDEISPDTTPDLAEAAGKTLARRLANGGGHTGWSRAWIINFRARLYEGEEALHNLEALFTQSTLPNLFDNHPPFQIDGNFGALAGITQMVVQSRMRYTENSVCVEIRLLPALPKNWSGGHLKGVRVRGNIELDITWREMKPVSLTLRNCGESIRVAVYGADGNREVVLPPGETSMKNF
jgi:alpha-L-fucosidase 2